MNPGDIVRVIKLVPDDSDTYVTVGSVGIITFIAPDDGSFKYPYDVRFGFVIRRSTIYTHHANPKNWQFSLDQLEVISEASEDNEHIIEMLSI